MVACHDCKIVGNGPTWETSRYGGVFWSFEERVENPYSSRKCRKCGKELTPVSRPGANILRDELKYEEVKGRIN